MKLLELSAAQKRILVEAEQYSASSVHILGGVVEIRAAIDASLLSKAINSLIESADALRIRLHRSNSLVQQSIVGHSNQEIACEDLSTFADAYERFQHESLKEFRKPFTLYNTPLHRFKIYRICEAHYAYLIQLHHIIADGWSIELLTKYIAHNYEALSENLPTTLSPLGSFADYLVSEQVYLGSDERKNNESFWIEHTAAAVESSSGNAVIDPNGARESFALDAARTEPLKAFERAHNVSTVVVFMGAVLWYLRTLEKRNALTVGFPLLGRKGRAERNLFGNFSNTMPFHFEFKEATNVQEYLEAISQRLKATYKHQKFPFNLLMRGLNKQAQQAVQLFDVAVNYYNTSVPGTIAGGSVTNTEYYSGCQPYPFQIIIKEWNGALSVNIDYVTERYSDASVNEFYRSVIHIVEQFAQNPNSNLFDLEISNAATRSAWQQLCNRTEHCATAPQLMDRCIERIALQQPDAEAVVFKSDSLTYAELNERASMLAHYLLKHGYSGKKIALMLEHSANTVVAILGVLKAGGCFVPIDSNFPDERLRHLLDDAQCALLITNATQVQERGISVPVLEWNNTFFDGRRNCESPQLERQLSDPAYIIYTSGSTGKPKGVLISHANLFNYITWASKQYLEPSHETFALFSPLTFDLTITSIFVPLYSGNRIAVYADGDEFVLKTILRENACTLLKLTPSHLIALAEIEDVDIGASNLRTLIVGGERFTVELANRIHALFGGRVRVFNEYGPTEVTVGCMIHKFDPVRDTTASVPIGVAIDNTHVFILNDELKSVPRGVKGELYVSGDSVAMGYINAAEETKKRFIDCPFEHKRMYRTGDIVCWNFDDSIEFIERKDQQIKVNGYRIEPAEIESRLLLIQGIEHAVVVKHVDGGKEELRAFYKSDGLDEFTIRKNLCRDLPSYMIPHRMIRVAEFPLSVNGKIDYAALKVLEVDVADTTQPGSVELTDAHQKILKVFETVLNVKAIQQNDNYFRLGGDSINAIQIASQLRELGYTIAVNDILTYPRIVDILSILEERQGEMVAGEGSNQVVHTPIFNWFLQQRFKERDHFQQSVLLEFSEPKSRASFVWAWSHLLEKHSALRLRYSEDADEFTIVNVPMEYAESVVHEYWLPEASEDTVLLYNIEKLRMQISITKGDILRVGLFSAGKDSGATQLVFIAIHHLAVDSVSWGILLKDLQCFIDAFEKQDTHRQSKRSIGYPEWTQNLFAYRQSLPKIEPLDASACGSHEVLLDSLSRAGTDEGVLSEHSFALEAELTTKLLDDCNRAYTTKPEELLFIALALTLQERFSEVKITIEVEGHGRDKELGGLDTASMVGWFTSIFPIVAEPPLAGTIDAKIKKLKEAFREQRELGFDRFLAHYGDKESIHPFPPALARFNFLGDFDTLVPSDHFRISQRNKGDDVHEENRDESLFYADMFVLEKVLHVQLRCAPKLVEAWNISAIGDAYLANLKWLLEHCIEQKVKAFTPSDFDFVDIDQDGLESLFGS